MAFALSRFRSATSRTLCEGKDVGYSCGFSKNSPNPLVQHLLDSSRSIESPIGLGTSYIYIVRLSVLRYASINN